MSTCGLDRAAVVKLQGAREALISLPCHFSNSKLEKPSKQSFN